MLNVKLKEKSKMDKYIKLFALILVIVFAANIMYGGPRNKVGTSAAPELLIPVGSIGTSLGGSNLSSVTGVDAIYWNVAGLSSINTNSAEVMFSHVTYFADMKLEYFGAAAKLGSLGVLGVTIKSLNIGEIAKTTEYEPDGTGEVFKPNYVIANIGFARQMTDRIRFGTNVKVISESVADVSATGFAFDFGLQYIGGQSGFSFGIAIKNLGSSMTFNGSGLDRQVQNSNGTVYTERVNLQDFDLPTNLEIGIGYKFRLADKMNIQLSGGFQNSSFSADEYKLGLEYNYNNMIFLRGAYNISPSEQYNGERLFGPSFGAGIRYPVGNLSLGFDYAYRMITNDGFNSTNQYFTLNVGF